MAGTVDRSRQDMDPRWNGDQVRASGVIIVGCGPCARMAAIAAASMGFGRVVLASEADGLTGTVLDHLGLFHEWLGERYPDVFVASLPINASVRMVRLLAGPMPVVVCELDSVERTSIPQLVRPARRIYIGAGADQAMVTLLEPVQAPAGPAGLDTAMLAAGLAANEARRIAGPCEEDGPPLRPVSFGLPPVRVEPAELHVAGCGGTGSLFVPAMAGFVRGSIIPWDGDIVEDTNLARCPFLDAAGTAKAAALASHPVLVEATCGPLNLTYAGESWLDDAAAGSVAAFCVDGISSRRVLNTGVCRTATPAVNLGTSLWGAVVNTINRSSPCLECRHPDLEERMQEQMSAALRLDACGRRPEASGIVSNMIAAGAGAMIARRLADPDFSFPGTLTWDAFSNQRLEVTSVREPCDCFVGRSVQQCLPM